MKTLINALPLTTLRVYPKIIPYHSIISYLSNRTQITYYSSDSENKSDEELFLEKLLLQNKMKNMTVKEFRGTWILKIMDLYYVGQKTDRFSSITLSDFNCYIDEINNEEYRLEQLSLIYFKPGVIGSDMHFKGVPERCLRAINPRLLSEFHSSIVLFIWNRWMSFYFLRLVMFY